MRISNRANTILLVAILAVGIGIVAMLAAGVRGGPLDPPGAPASTDGVRQPGTPISSLPYAITQPGRYYVTRNLSSSGTAITVAASDVVVDLGGFTIDGQGSNGNGVYDLGQSNTNVSVEHGTIRGFVFTVMLSATTYGHISDVHVISPNGIGIETQVQGVLEDCEVSGGGAGAGVNLAPGSVMRRCYIHDLAGAGVSAHADSVVEDSVIDFAGTRGVSVPDGTGVTIRNNRFRANGPANNSDVVVTSGAATAIDNDINCTTSVSAIAPGQVVTSGASGDHQNIPLFSGPTFC
jgi:hypothetical protein